MFAVTHARAWTPGQTLSLGGGLLPRLAPPRNFLTFYLAAPLIFLTGTSETTFCHVDSQFTSPSRLQSLTRPAFLGKVLFPTKLVPVHSNDGTLLEKNTCFEVFRQEDRPFLNFSNRTPPFSLLFSPYFFLLGRGRSPPRKISLRLHPLSFLLPTYNPICFPTPD